MDLTKYTHRKLIALETNILYVSLTFLIIIFLASSYLLYQHIAGYVGILSFYESIILAIPCIVLSIYWIIDITKIIKRNIDFLSLEIIEFDEFSEFSDSEDIEEMSSK